MAEDVQTYGIWDEVDTGEFEDLPIPSRLQLRIDGFAHTKAGDLVMRVKDGGNTSIALAVSDVNNPKVSGLDWFNLNKKNMWRMLAINKSLGLSKAVLAKATAGREAQITDTEFPQDVFESLVTLWTGRCGWADVKAGQNGRPAITWLATPAEPEKPKAELPF